LWFRCREFIRRAAAALLILICSAPAHALTRFEYSEVAMGVRARVVLYATDEAIAQKAARAAYDGIATLEDIMSDYRPTSELSRLSAKSGGPAVEVSPELAFILGKCQELSRRSDGAFDCTIGPLVKLWRAARKSGQLPPRDQLTAARKLVGWRKLHVDGRSVKLDTPGMLLDLGGIAKGYACDEAIRVLKQYGIKTALVQMGGDIVVSNAPPGTKGWQIQVANAPDHKTLTLSNHAVSSSGDTEQFVEIAGKRYSHIVDPRSGLGLTNRIAVTVIAPDGLTSDGLSTAISVLGPTRGKTLASTYPGVTTYIRTAH
jgi:thiamine biosynthesis lipoprotein